MGAISQAAFLLGKTPAWGNMCRKQKREKSGKWRMTAEALPAADPAVLLLVGCQHLPGFLPVALAGRVQEASQALIQIAFCYSP